MIYINDFAEGLKSSVKLFADAAHFSIVKDPTKSSNELNSNLKVINNWAFFWKMSFNPDHLKQATEVRFSEKSNAINHPDLVFNNIVHKAWMQKHFGLILDDKPNFKEYIDKNTAKLRKVYEY